LCCPRLEREPPLRVSGNVSTQNSWCGVRWLDIPRSWLAENGMTAEPARADSILPSELHSLGSFLPSCQAFSSFERSWGKSDRLRLGDDAKKKTASLGLFTLAMRANIKRVYTGVCEREDDPAHTNKFRHTSLLKDLQLSSYQYPSSPDS